MPTDYSRLDILGNLLDQARAAGADAADAILVDGVSLSLSQRLGKPEHLERSEGSDAGLRVFIGKRQAIVSSSDVSMAALAELAERAVAMAKNVPEDPHCGLAEPDQLATEIESFESCDPVEPEPDVLLKRVKIAEEAALAVDGVTNSEGADSGWGRTVVAVAATNGFSQVYRRSSHSISVSVLAGEGTAMERDYDYSAAVFAEDLEDPAKIGRTAGENTVKRLNPRKVPSQQVPVIYDPRTARSILGHLAGAINGSGIARGTSFLKDRMGEQIFPAGVTVVDDPLRHRGLRSKPFDAEGIATQCRNVIEDGRLTTWILDLRSARQLGLETTGHASRGTGSPPSPSTSNLYLKPGTLSPAELIKDVKQGFYVTELIGFGVNGVTGDYSRGAGGFWIEDGEIAYPVNEMTVAGNLNDMFKHLTAADDLTFKYGTDAPTLRIDGMTVAGA